MTKIKTAIGLMSGTSMDGIDVALLKTDGLRHVEFGPFATILYSALETQAIAKGLEEAQQITRRDQRPGNLKGLEKDLTFRHCEAVNAFLADNSLSAGDIDVIGFHGQTVLHRPNEALTVQLGDGALMAERLGVDVVWDMRANDMANGGQGAPLVPVFHQALAARADKPVAFVNIGGISNVTFVLPDADPIAFDCGPGNALVDDWMQTHTNQSFDEGGQLGLQGIVSDEVLYAYLADPFFQKKVPKSLDRNDFSLSPMPNMSPADGAATLAALTAHSIAHAAKAAEVHPKRWIISGGGAHNRAILHYLGKALPDADVETAEQAGLSSDGMEAQAWAYLAVRSLRGLPLTFPTTTGCDAPVTGGVLATPISAS